MSLVVDPVLACAGLVVLNGAWALFLGTRDRAAHMRREAETHEAVNLLSLHIEALEVLDDDAVPCSVSAFALELSELLHDAEKRPTMVELARQRAAWKRAGGRVRTKPDNAEAATELRRDVEALRAVRPDLAEAFGRSIVAGVLSFERMFPECAGAIGLDVAKLVASPVTEAERVVHRTRDMRRAWPTSTTVPAGA